jgi:hypothetical protein
MFSSMLQKRMGQISNTIWTTGNQQIQIVCASGNQTLFRIIMTDVRTKTFSGFFVGHIAAITSTAFATIENQ